jgi:hypothetical protein
MSGQYSPSAWPGDYQAQDRRQNSGTPLGRIVLGVFLGLLTWTVVMVAIAFTLAVTVLSQVEDTFNSNNATSASSSR